MSDDTTEDAPDDAPLTVEQRALLVGAAGVARRAMARVIREYGRRLGDDALGIAELAVIRAARSFDPGRGTPFPRWAYWRAYHALLTAARVDAEQQRNQQAMRAATVRRLEEQRYEQPEPTTIDELQAWEEEAPDRLSALAASYVDEMVEAAMDPAEQLLAREEARRTMAALRQVLGELSQDQIDLLALQHRDEKKVKLIAAELRVDYNNLLDKAAALRRRLRARLEFLGVRELPQWVDLGAGSVFDERAGAGRGDAPRGEE